MYICINGTIFRGRHLFVSKRTLFVALVGLRCITKYLLSSLSRHFIEQPRLLINLAP